MEQVCGDASGTQGKGIAGKNSVQIKLIIIKGRRWNNTSYSARTAVSR